MTLEEYMKKMKELGWDDKHIEKCIQNHEDAKKAGITIPLELDLFETPINY